MYTKFISFLLLMSCCYNQAQVVLDKVGDNPTIILPSAALEVASTTKGFLPPRMTNAQRNAIIDPVEGLIVYCTDCNPKCTYLFNGTNWGSLCLLPPAALASLNCAGATSNGTLIQGTVASGVSSVVSYTGGNGGTYTERSYSSTGVTGLTATLAAGTLAYGAGTLTYTITGTPSSSGIASFAINLGGQTCALTRPVYISDRAYGLTINGANNHNFVYGTVTGADGKTWLNNNLGAHYANVNHASFNPAQQATSATDHLAYGSLFQWGRAADGHELITYTNSTNGTAVNGTTATRPGADTADNALFITISSGNYDWRGSIQNDALWQGVSGTNNPCPVGYRLPTLAELTTLVTTSSITNSATAASSAMKFTVPGRRFNGSGSLNILGSFGYYWSSSVSGTGASFRRFYSGGTDTFDFGRAYGLTVRCLKE
jgi:uncharacterized protein (TIGR02145 family)